MNKKTRITSFSLILVIIGIQAVLLVCVCMLKNNMDSFIYQYRQNEAQSYSALHNIEEMSADVYQHEILVSKYITENDPKKAFNYVEEATILRENVEDLMIQCDFELRDMEGFEQYELYGELKKAITAYFNSVDILYEIKDKNSMELALYMFNNNMSHYINVANEYKEVTQAMVNNTLDKSKISIGNSIVAMRLFFGLGIVFIFIITSGMLWAASKIMIAHEEDTEENRDEIV